MSAILAALDPKQTSARNPAVTRRTDQLGVYSLFSTLEVQQITESIASDFSGSTTESEHSILVELRQGPKKVLIDWPKHDLSEMWMTFFEADEETSIYQEWFECMEKEDKAEFVEYTRTVAARFLENPSRVRQRGPFFLRRSILEIATDNGWRDIFDPELDE